MTDKQPEALQLADLLEESYPLEPEAEQSAAELRRQHQEITELKKVKEALLEENSTLRKCATECLKFAANMKNKDMS